VCRKRAPGGLPGNIIDVEPDTTAVAPDYASHGLALEIVGSTGVGFKTVLDTPKALDRAVHVAVAVERLRRLLGTLP
jgi:hypothetical protein